MADGSPLTVKVWGEFACFTRPEMKVERVSYPMMTPSAARGVLEAIFWKPEFSWQVDEIWLLKPIAYIALLRNEVNSRASERSARDWARNGGGFSAPEDRAQRNTLVLRDVAYVIQAQAVPNSGTEADRAKYRDQFRRRVQRGQCFATPYLGCREFSAAFAPVEEGDRPAEVSGDLGRMLREMVFAEGGRGAATPEFFDAHVHHGVLRVPPVGQQEE